MGFDSLLLAETSPDSPPTAVNARSATGVLWVHPQEKFTELTPGGVSLGRSPESSTALDGSQVSRNHAVIVHRQGVYSVRDLASRNGTFVGGQRVSEAPLVRGSVLRIGEWVGVVCEISTVTRDSESLFLEGIPGLLVGPQSQQQWLHLEQLARSEQPILIEGPTGTGKEVIARAIHQSSGRLGALVAINCAALPESLVEAQLFGHSKGAFTGAVQASPGLIASAEGGTVLLDEIAELPLSQQAKLLRAIEERAVLRVGETTPRPVNVRYVAACQQSLWRLCQGGRFRADLVGRLAGGRLRLLPLEQRREEIPRLFCDYFARAGGNPQLLTHTAIEALCVAAWPLNIRQVVQSARLAAVTCCDKLPINGVVLRGILGQVHEGEEPSSADSVALPQENSVPAEEIPKSRRSRWLDRHRGALADLLKALQLSGGNVSEACRRSGLPRWRAVRLLEVHVQENSAR